MLDFDIENLNILPVAEIPTEVQDVPLDDLSEIYKICKAMQILCEKKHGLGLSAVQVGIPYKLFVLSPVAFNLRTGGYTTKSLSKCYRYFINTAYQPIGDRLGEKIDEQIMSTEGCLSLVGKRYKVPRWTKIRVVGQELVKKGSKISARDIDYNLFLKLNGDVVFVFQHEIDHQNLITIDQIGEINAY